MLSRPENLNDICPSLIRDVVSYDRATGFLFWKHRPPEFFRAESRSAEHCAKVWNSVYQGKLALHSIGKNGYRRGYIFQVAAYAHQVIWLIHNSVWPSQIDHINGNRIDNRIENLRIVTSIENGQNQKLSKSNSSGATGITLLKKGKKRWQAQIGHKGRHWMIGRFETFEEAIKARKAEESRLGFHPNHGRKS